MTQYQQKIVGPGISTILPTMDFETYSEAGYYWDPVKDRWRGTTSQKPGLPAVGASVYSEHPSTEVLCLAYNLQRGKGPQLWTPGQPPPIDLFNHMAQGGLLEAWNSPFEYYIWLNVCHARMGWPQLPYQQLRDAMTKSYAFSMPGALDNAAIVMGTVEQKDPKGKALIRKLSVPRSPSKKDARQRYTPLDMPQDFNDLYTYCIQDIKTEESVATDMPDLQSQELEIWLLDQKINFTGVAVDAEGVKNCIDIINQAQEKYTLELQLLTGGLVESATQVSKMQKWLAHNGLALPSLAKDKVEAALERQDISPLCRRVLEIRVLLGSASVKKLFAIERRTSRDGRLRSLFAFCGADRTGRWAGRGPQPQNLPNSGPVDDWGIEAVEEALRLIATKDLSAVETKWGDATATVSGCLRGLFCAGPGHDLICSDYSAIEAVVLAFLADEKWRMDVFNTHGMIYEMSTSKITGIPFEEFVTHKQQTGNHHPLRKKLGKIAELASGYQGGPGAWKAFEADKYLSEEEIKENVRLWRQASPNIVKFWYGLEKAALAAVQLPGNCYSYRGITFGVKDDVLYCKLLSGRLLTYHQPRLHNDVAPWGKEVVKLTFMGWNSNPKKGPMGWIRLETYGGKLTENVVQATARDILAHGMLTLDKAGYNIVLHVHDEIIAEVPEGTGSIEEFETLMSTMPAWCSDWPIKATGGWRGGRYRKD